MKSLTAHTAKDWLKQNERYIFTDFESITRKVEQLEQRSQ